MDYDADITSIYDVKRNTDNIIRQINQTKRPIIIEEHGETKGVIIDAQSFEDMQNALGMLKLLSISEKNLEANKFI